MTHHFLKTVDPYFGQVKSGAKTFELRRNDRNFQSGDILHLQQWSEESGFTGEICQVRVVSILENCPEYGLMEGFCILSIKLHFAEAIRGGVRVDPDVQLSNRGGI